MLSDDLNGNGVIHAEPDAVTGGPLPRIITVMKVCCHTSGHIGAQLCSVKRPINLWRIDFPCANGQYCLSALPATHRQTWRRPSEAFV